MKEIILPFYARIAFILVMIIAMGYLAILGKEILAPLLFAFLFAILLMPAASFLERRCRMKRGLAALFSVLLLVIIVSLVLFLLGNQLSNLISDWPMLKAQITNAFHDLQLWIYHRFNINANKQITYINDSATKMLASTASVIGITLLTLSSTLLFYLFTLLFTFFILLNRRLLFQFLLALFNKQHADTIFEITRQIQRIIKQYITGLFLQMCILTVITCIVLSVMGVKYAILLGMLTGIFNVVPYIGIFTALLISVLITFATASAAKALFVAIAFLLIHSLDGNIIMPVVVGGKVKLNALIVMLGIIIGEMIWGIPGMFLCVPYIAMLKIVFDRIDDLRPWGILLGDEISMQKQVKLIKNIFRI
ncbi:AI-2E family transporter [Pedobacter sp. BS3]|uniref:AI-2E family transporter n=1 Tax=Pedobacter sp. BS3 TaxID=2567937 RepID=UPI0011EDAA43|nr:AI-2E family transporter [Pedobacter sp. BS3]TZF81500.1 AI-2E family transporter [Pedobacter sp. BS3]